VERVALAVFARGQAIAEKGGLTLVDTKYEFGLIDGKLALIDEIHTPDSSRFWIQGSMIDGEPENLDKEFIRKWFVEHGYRGEGVPPTMPAEFIAFAAQRYLSAYEKLTGRSFVPGEQPATERIQQAMALHIAK
jgi:phosphoribosylaminoimidazole-succinocarboxamide synthase